MKPFIILSKKTNWTVYRQAGNIHLDCVLTQETVQAELSVKMMSLNSALC